jgi:glycosyltransferase involved in cell wall biosynthesis
MSEPLPFFSVIVPTYRRIEALPTCLEALAGQAYPRDRFEVLIVDDGGSASLEPVVAAFRERMHITLLSQPHGGPARARNTGAAHARGEFLAFTDDDCAPDAGWLHCLAARFAATPGHMIGGQTVNALRQNCCSAASQLLVDYLYEYYNAGAAQPSFFTSNNMALPQRAFLAIGGFDATLMSAAGEDRELSDRWQHLGYGLTYAPEALVAHHHRLSLRQFWCQHFEYGRAARYFRMARVQRGSGRVAIEPWAFYLNLLRYPFTQERPLQAVSLSALLFLSQCANALGFVWEQAAGRNPPMAVDPLSLGVLQSAEERASDGGRNPQGNGATPSESMRNPRPRLTVIIPSYNATATIGDCLESLRYQATNDRIEIIVVDSGTDGTGDFVQERFPAVRTYRFAERQFCGAARNWGVARARGDIVAFLDADCTASPTWVTAVLHAHESPDLVVGGAIANGARRGLVSWGAFLCEFSQWMPHRPAGKIPEVAGANMSCKRAAFDGIGSFIEGTYCSDTEFHWRLAARGHTPRFDPTILVTHYSITDLGRFLKHEYAHGRDFGRVRARHWRWPSWKKALYVALAFVIPWKLLAQIAGRCVRNGAYLLQFLASLPLLILGLHAWVLGECSGYLCGARQERRAVDT